MNEYHFYDTSALLEKVDELFQTKENIIISTTVLEELEKLKTSNKKEENLKHNVRKLLRKLQENIGQYEVVIFNKQMLKPFEEKCLDTANPDIQILSAAYYFDHNITPDEVIFYTNDLSLFNIANLFFGQDSIRCYKKEELDDYTGYKEIQLSDDKMADFYSDLTKNHFNQLINEYLFIKDNNNNIVDILKWTNEGYQPLKFNSFNSKMFGKIKPKDPYQRCAFDSLSHNQITMLKGPAGSGKSMLAVSFLISQLEAQKIDKIIIFCNTVATKNSARLGFYPGSRDEKLLDSQIGNFLSSKFGSKIEVECLIKEEKIILLPMSDCRGYDTSGMNAGIYITEAQNMDISLMKLALQRVGEDSIVIIDGDCNTQVDLEAFANENNGMKRMSKVFRGCDLYGEISLNQIHRSKISAIAENM